MDWRLLLAFVAGVVVTSLIPALPAPAAVVTAGVVALVMLLLPRWRLPAVFVLGAIWFIGHALWLASAEWPAERDRELLTVTGTVVGLPEQRGRSLRFEFRPDTVQATAVDQRLPARIQVSWYRPLEYVVPGQRWQISLRMSSPRGRLNPGGFDLRRHLLAHRIGAQATVVGRPESLQQVGWRGLVDRQRQFLAEVLQAETQRSEAGALMRALAIADRSAMSSELANRLRQTGTAHLLAISGLHVGMVAGVAALLASWLLAPLVLLHSALDRRRLAIAAGLVAATVYALLAGLTLPTQRALIMLLVGGAAFLLRRSIQPGHALLVALGAILLLDPMAPLASGFWLSFAAVAVLVWAFAWRPAGDAGSAGQWLSGLFRAQLLIGIGMLPLNVGLFQQLIPAALPANLLAVPLVGFWVLPALLTSVVLILLDLPAGWPLWLAEQGLILTLDWLAWLHAFEWGHRQRVGGGLLAVVLASIGAFWLLAPSGWPARSLGLLLFLPLLWPRAWEPAPGELELWLLDVGDGLAVLVRTNEQRLLYDTGPGDGEGGDAIGRILPSMPARAGRESIDRLVLSHGHRGHVGGRGSVTASEVWAWREDPREGPVKRCVSGAGWHSDGFDFRFLHPSAGLPDLGAGSSCVLLIEGEAGRVLLTGGIGADVERRLLVEQPELRLDLLQLPAGGHRRGGSTSLLERSEPRWAVASVAAGDRFDRPHSELVERLKAAEVELVTTASCGALRLRLRPGQPPELRSQATLQPRFWRPRDACP